MPFTMRPIASRCGHGLEAGGVAVGVLQSPRSLRVRRAPRRGHPSRASDRRGGGHCCPGPLHNPYKDDFPGPSADRSCPQSRNSMACQPMVTSASSCFWFRSLECLRVELARRVVDEAGGGRPCDIVDIGLVHGPGIDLALDLSRWGRHRSGRPRCADRRAGTRPRPCVHRPAWPRKGVASRASTALLQHLGVSRRRGHRRRARDRHRPRSAALPSYLIGIGVGAAEGIGRARFRLAASLLAHAAALATALAIGVSQDHPRRHAGPVVPVTPSAGAMPAVPSAARPRTVHVFRRRVLTSGMLTPIVD